jgi:general L-amino acid transport system substrate-binding protein
VTSRQCRAIAAVTLGDPELFEIVDIPIESRFMELASGSIDVYTRAVSTMERDLNEITSGEGFSFSIPYLYGGVAYGGNEFFVQCADDLNTQGDCSGLQVCAPPGIGVELILPAAHIVLLWADDLQVAFIEGRCNVVFGSNWDQALVLIGDELFGPGQAVGNILAYMFLCLVTRDDDPHWSDIVNHMIQSLITGEAQGITQSMAQDFVAASNFGLGSEFMFQTAIAAVGNYGEMYERHFEWFLPRSEINLINVNGTTGILMSPLFDGVLDSGPEPVAGGEVEVITTNGHLTCGITDQRPGFAEFNSTSGRWSGLDVDYCRALVSSLFFGRVTDETLIFLEFDSPEEGRSALADSTVDVLCGQRVSLQVDIAPGATGKGYTFSLPYFYEAPDR